MKRFAIKFLSLALVLNVFAGILAPSAALARRHMPPPPPPRYHRQHHHDLGRTLAGIAIIAGLGHVISNASRPSYNYSYDYNDYNIVVESPEAQYEREKTLFIYKMDKGEKKLWEKIKVAPPGEYFYNYGEEGADGRRVKKFAKTLYKDIEFIRNDTENNTVYFRKLSESE